MTVSETVENVALGSYLFSRLQQVNSLKSIFGVPGDFNLSLLEHLYNFPDLNWIGNCNELNAGYAADGYARVNKFGVLVTTFGVGELSALNAISGSFTENVPVLHIVGTSSTMAKKLNNKTLHHLIPSKNTWEVAQDHYVYEKIVEPFSCIVESLNDDDLTVLQSKIDNVIETIYKSKKPGYLFIPSNLADIQIPIDTTKKLEFNSIDKHPEFTNQIVSKIIDKLYKKKSAILADNLIKNRKDVLNNFIQSNNIDCFSTVLGKSIIDETFEKFHGVFNGKISSEGAADTFSKFELILHLGVVTNEINNFNNLKAKDFVGDVVELGKDYVLIDDELITSVDGEIIFDSLLAQIEPMKLCTDQSVESWGSKRSYPSSPTLLNATKKLSQSSMAKILESKLREGDVIVCEMCSFLFAIPDIKFPKDSLFISQNFYGSIGYALPSTLGASLAIRDAGLESKRRVILLQGDGSAQMTIQELSSYVRYGIKPTVLLLNNDGYSVERVCCGPTRSYNDIQPNWNWLKLFNVFGDVENKSVNVRVETNHELEMELNKDDGELKMIEVMLDKMDVPWRFSYVAGKAK